MVDLVQSTIRLTFGGVGSGIHAYLLLLSKVLLVGCFVRGEGGGEDVLVIIPHPLPRMDGGGGEVEGGVIFESLGPCVRLSIRRPIRVSDFVRTISSEPRYHFFFIPNLVWRCIIMRRNVKQKIGSLFSMSRSQRRLI